MLIQNVSNTTSASAYSNENAHVFSTSSQTKGVASDFSQVTTQSNYGAVQGGSTSQPTASQLKNAVDSINHSMKLNNSNIEFSIDKDSKQTVVKVVDSLTGQIISQFPSKEALAISQAIGESQHGVLVKQQA